MNKICNISLLIIFYIFSCSTVKELNNDSIYGSIINDLKGNISFNNFSNEYDNCTSIEISKYLHDICLFNIEYIIQLAPENIDIINAYEQKKCSSNVKNKNDKSKDIRLDKFSDTGDNCFKLFFYERINNKIVVTISPKNSVFSYTTLNYIYEITNNNSVKLTKAFEVMVN